MNKVKRGNLRRTFDVVNDYLFPVIDRNLFAICIENVVAILVLLVPKQFFAGTLIQWYVVTGSIENVVTGIIHQVSLHDRDFIVGEHGIPEGLVGPVFLTINLATAHKGLGKCLQQGISFPDGRLHGFPCAAPLLGNIVRVHQDLFDIVVLLVHDEVHLGIADFGGERIRLVHQTMGFKLVGSLVLLEL